MLRANARRDWHRVIAASAACLGWLAVAGAGSCSEETTSTADPAQSDAASDLGWPSGGAPDAVVDSASGGAGGSIGVGGSGDAAPPPCTPAGPVWADEQKVDIGNESAPGRTGQWWCDNHFGGNLGGVWECVAATGGCGVDVPDNGSVSCGRLGADGSTPYCGSGADGGALGYGRVEAILVTQSSPGRTGRWWCDNHFGGNLGGSWKCRSVSGGYSCADTVPNGQLVSCSQYDDVQSVTASSPAPGQNGQWWCDKHFGGNLGGSWDCLGVAPGQCGQDAAAGAVVTCGRYGAVDESAFSPPGCSSNELDGAEKEFCNGTEYMTTRAGSALYLFNNWIRAGFNRSFGGALFELYGPDKRNRIEEHGGAAAQLSIWGYDVASTGAGWFTTLTCNSSPFSDQAACTSANGGSSCAYFPATGGQICDCTSVKPCGTWSAGAPWNPIQAQASGCGWNGPSNDVSSIEQNADGVQMTQVAPYHFTKTTAFTGMTWSVAGQVPSDRPYLRLRYRMTWSGTPAVGEHNQEIPAIFRDSRTAGWYYFYRGSQPYSDATGLVTRLRVDFGSELALPGRADPLPQPTPANLVEATEEWMTACDHSEDQCLTLVTFSPLVKTFVQAGHYVTALGRFAIGSSFDEAWDVYMFPYRFDQVVAGRTVREWVYQLRQES